MSFRAKLLLTIIATVALSVWLVAWAVSAVLTRHFENEERQRSAAALAGFQRELDERRTEVEALVERGTRSENFGRLVSELATGTADAGAYLAEAGHLANTLGLDYVDIVGPDRNIVSSSHSPARFGYSHPLITERIGGDSQAGLQKFETSAGEVIALLAIRSVPSGENRVFLIGGRKLDEALLDSFSLPPNVRVELYSDGSAGSLGIVDEARRTGKEISRPAETRLHGLRVEEALTALPLRTLSGDIAAVVLFRQTKTDLALLKSYIRQIALAVGIGGIGVGLLFGWLVAGKVTRPLRELHGTVEELGRGNWDADAPVRSSDEVGQLASAFNRMKTELVESRDRVLQAERVAAWRELARRLAHELKNPLFPLQITVENLQRARPSANRMISQAEFEEIFEESTRTLLDEVQHLKTIVNQFGDFAKMPAPQLKPVSLNEIVEKEAGLLRPQIERLDGATRELRLELDRNIPKISGDVELLRGVLRNLLLNAIDAMPSGGQVIVRTSTHGSSVRVEVSDTGVGLTTEERERLFTPYYTTKTHGTGLGLAIVQSVVSDHHASISVRSEPGKGTTFLIDFRAGLA